MEYEKKARELRGDILRQLIAAKSGHPGGSLSCVEILMALYYEVMRVDPNNPKAPDRDRFVLSKGHACPALYAVLADKGFFPRKDLPTFRSLHSYLQGHPDCSKTPGVDVNTGSLGQGASISVGLALGAKLKKAEYKVYTLLGDGECQEGLIWEAAMAAGHYRLDNLTFILDYNHLQIDGTNDEVMSLGNIDDKFRSFGFTVYVVEDGHDIGKIKEALLAPASGRPKFIRCETVKGKGVSFMENAVGWHGAPMNEEQFAQAYAEQGLGEPEPLAGGKA